MGGALVSIEAMARASGAELTKEQFIAIARLKALQNKCEGERKAFGLARGIKEDIERKT